MTELNATLLQVLACPNCHGGLVVDYEASELVCSAPECGLAYPVRDGIPVLLVDEARPPRRPGTESASDPEPDPGDAPA